MSRRWGWLLLLVLSIGCGEAATGPGASGQKEAGPKKLRIAVIPKGTTHDFWKSVHAGAKKAADELGNVEILWKGTNNEKDKEGQIKLVEGYIVEQVDGIVLAPIDRDALVPVVTRAKTREIPTVIFDSGLANEEICVSYVATDNYHGGVMAGEHLAKLLNGEGSVILVPYQEGSESTEQREKGFLDTIAKHPKIKVLSADQRVSSDAEQALQISTSLFVAHGDAVDGVFTVCEPINKGMLRAIENRKLGGKVKFVGFDSDPRFVEAMKQKTMHGIILQDPVNMGYLAVKAMADHLAGKPVEKRMVTGETLATPENMSEPKIDKLLHPDKFGE
ncbi:MAG: substrate-binding domain-containing protein [Planctomycetaceae bacterium]